MPSSSRCRIVLAEHHPIYRLGVRTLLEHETDLEIVGEAIDGEQAITMVLGLRPDVLLLEHLLPDISGLEVLRRLGVAKCPTKAIVLTAAMEEPDLRTALLHGAWGVVFKNTESDILPQCVRRVMLGEHWVGFESVDALVAGLHVSRNERRSGLTPRELDVVRGIAKGESNKDIAWRLGLSEQTVKNYLRRIFEKLNVANRVELALHAFEKEMIDDDSAPGLSKSKRVQES
jgi:two-component system, NarL family, nitrate/nitrite response regulator NarL